jgi:hypothetical protein
LVGVEEEVITTGIDADFNDYMSDQKHGLLPGIDLSDPHQLASLTKYVPTLSDVLLLWYHSVMLPGIMKD